VYPEFKGYFRDWRWADFDTSDGRMIIETDSYGSFLGLYNQRTAKTDCSTCRKSGLLFLT